VEIDDTGNLVDLKCKYVRTHPHVSSTAIWTNLLEYLDFISLNVHVPELYRTCFSTFVFFMIHEFYEHPKGFIALIHTYHWLDELNKEWAL
jgi:hypothetical protein